jgi:hypothetical protein
MDEITLVNILNKICETNQHLSWQLNCKYHTAQDASVMEIRIFETQNKSKVGWIIFAMDSGRIHKGKYRSMVPFDESTNLIDALLEVLHFEASWLEPALN